jgi:uncharacterized protein (TIGR02453 family)
MNGKIILEFLNQIAANNNREWFHANKPLYNKAKKQMEDITSELIPALYEFDKTITGISAKDTVFRIFRDIRFSKNKLPYKTNMGGFMAPGGRKSVLPGYYLHIEPGASFIGGGIYMPQPDNLKAIRNEIYFDVDAFKKVINEKNFQKYYGGLSDMGDSLKTAPKGFDKDWPDIDLLRYKHYVCGHNIKDEVIASDDFIPYTIDAFKAMKGLNEFLRIAIENKE